MSRYSNSARPREPPPAPLTITSSVQNDLVRPRRPGFGSKGRSIKLAANVFPVKFAEDLIIHHYDVDIQPDVKPPIKRRLFAIWTSLSAKSSNTHLAKYSKLCIYDGSKNIFSPENLGINGTETFDLELNDPEVSDKSKKFKMAIKIATTVDLSALSHYLSDRIPASTPIGSIEYPRNAISALEVLMRHVPSLTYATFGRGGGSFFDSSVTRPLPEGLAVYKGWMQSLRPSIGKVEELGGQIRTYKQLLMNLDVAHTAFYLDGPLPNLVANFFGCRVEDCQRLLSRGENINRLTRFLKLVQIKINYRQTGRKQYRIDGLTQSSAKDTVIELESSRVDLVDYFKKEYNVQLRYPWMPCIITGNGRVKIPMELCNVLPNQRYAGKLNESQTAEMIKITASKPQERKQKIEAGIRALHDRNDVEFLKSWGVSVSSEMMTVDGRVLTAPALTFKNGAQVARDGQWRYDNRNSFASPRPLKSWAVAVFASRLHMDQVDAFIKGLVGTLLELGVDVNKSITPSDLIVFQNRSDSVSDVLKSAMNRSHDKKCPDMVFCVLDDGRSDLYTEIKRVAETDFGLMTQCCLRKHVAADVSRKKPYFANIALKINTKLGGVNCFIEPTKELPPIGPTRVPTMIIGADVTHPAPGSEANSIAAVVASMDSRFAEYRTSIRVQNSRVEIIQELANMVKELFMIFYERHKVYPKRILFYRDGVSEGQFGEVVLAEVMAMKRMFRELCGNEMPAITFLSVNKRHHVRFFTTDPRDADRSGNVPTGTVVDRDITHPYEFDFFLNSHPGLQGTSRSTHYHVLYDENGFTADTLQELTYRLCFLYCRSTRAVSLVPPAYYAHLVADRARCYLQTDQSIKTVLADIQKRMFFV